MNSYLNKINDNINNISNCKNNVDWEGNVKDKFMLSVDKYLNHLTIMSDNLDNYIKQINDSNNRKGEINNDKM